MATSAALIEPGEIRVRTEIIPVFGGSAYEGICPAVELRNVVLYSDEEAGAQFGYRDGWVIDEGDGDAAGRQIFEYTGAGTKGDQTFDGPGGRRNTAVLKHAEQGRTLHLFVAVGKVPGTNTKLHRYVGVFKLDEHAPYTVRAARDVDGKLRRVIVFRLRQAGPIHFDQHDEVPPAPNTKVELVPASVTQSKLIALERGTTPVSARAGVPATQAERREAALSEMLEEQLRIAKHHVARYQIHITGKTARLLTDIYDVTAHTLYELKSDSSRESVRMALGQLLDYCRFVDSETQPGPPRLVIALPMPPDDDLRDLLAAHGVLLTYPVDGTFVGLPM